MSGRSFDLPFRIYSCVLLVLFWNYYIIIGIPEDADLSAHESYNGKNERLIGQVYINPIILEEDLLSGIEDLIWENEWNMCLI